MNRLDVDTWYEKIEHCSVCSSINISKESLDNHTLVQVSCSDCYNETMVMLSDNELEDYD